MGGWSVYYSERGVRTGEVHFDTEQEACDYLLNAPGERSDDSLTGEMARRPPGDRGQADGNSVVMIRSVIGIVVALLSVV